MDININEEGHWHEERSQDVEHRNMEEGKGIIVSEDPETWQDKGKGLVKELGTEIDTMISGKTW